MYEPDIAEVVIDSLLEFISSTLQEEEDSKEIKSISSESQSENEMITPFILIFDQVSFMDASSWRLIEACKTMFTRLAVVFLMESELGSD